jgi:hypothetical protein
MIMKKYLFISVILLGFSNGIFAQSTTKNLSQDESMRAAYASYYLDEVQPSNYVFNTPSGEASANIILKAYRDKLTILNISLEKIDAADKAKIEKLIVKLTQLTENPPTWEEITIMEKNLLIKVDKAMSKTSRYKTID